MSDSIAVVTEAMAAIEEKITGIEKAFSFDDTPNALSTGIMPGFTNIPGAAKYVDMSEQLGYDVSAEVREYTAWLWLRPLQRPADISTHSKEVRQFIQRVKAYFLGRPQLGGTRRVLSARMTADTGPMVADYMGNGTEYTCVGFTFSVAYLEKVTFGDGD